MKSDRQNNLNGWDKEIGELISAASGGFLFGIPLLYTMEVWFIGSFIQPPILLSVLVIMFVVVVLLNKIEGFREQQAQTFWETTAESIETLAIGIVCTTLMLIVLGRIDLETPLSEILGKIIFESVPFCLGVAFSRSLLTGNTKIDFDPEDQQSTGGSSSKGDIWHDSLADFGATLIGTLFVAFSIAPTEEVIMLAASFSPLELLILIFVSLYISYGIVFAAQFTNYDQRHQQQGLFQNPQTETIISYLISLIAGIIMLWFFHQLTFSDPWFIWLRYGIILGFPASIGGAAGRLTV
ncbi:integral membrane protein TIGR02587 [Chondrocystis sp. NIES-4102]|nr:integral membrane protein TIGR02587 [Chondrocystis sp. NIES-4102]